MLLAYLVRMCCGFCSADWSIRNVLLCVNNVTFGVNGTNVLAGTDTTTIKMYCDDGTFNQLVGCLENMYVYCGDSSSLEDVAVPTLWQSAAETLCNRLPEHSKHSVCITEQRETIRKCLHYNDQMFNTNDFKKATLTTLIIRICAYFEGIRLCTSEPVVSKCDARVGGILSDFIFSIQPRLCDPRYIRSSSSRHIHTTILLYVCTIFLSTSLVFQRFTNQT